MWRSDTHAYGTATPARKDGPRYCGRLLSFRPGKPLREIIEIKQFRFIQKTAGQCDPILLATPDFERVQHLHCFMGHFLANNARCRIVRGREIPPLRSGKRPYVVNEHLKEPSRNIVQNWDSLQL